MARQDKNSKDKLRPAGKPPGSGRTAPGSHGKQGRGGEQYQAKDMGAHPAYGKQARDPDGKEEDYGSRGLHRRAGTTKLEGPAERGIGHAEDYDARYDAESSKVSGQPQTIVKGQGVHEREATGRPERSRGDKSRHGYKEVGNDGKSGEDDLDISPGAAGGGKRSKRDPASR